MHRNKLHISLLAVSVLMAAAGSATAADLYAGGATFPAPAYVGDLYNSLSPKARLSRDAAITAPAVGFSVAGLGNSTGSKVPVFAKYRTLFPSDAVSYCQTGSGTGKKVLNNDTVFANGNCGDASSAAATGFTALSTTPDFIGTDSPISTADYNTFNTNMASTRTAIVQIPTIAGAIALPFKDNAATGLTSVALTTQQVCQIYSAQITDWADSRLGLTLSGSPHPITIVYRSEGSGTSRRRRRLLQARPELRRRRHPGRQPAGLCRRLAAERQQRRGVEGQDHHRRARLRRYRRSAVAGRDVRQRQRLRPGRAAGVDQHHPGQPAVRPGAQRRHHRRRSGLGSGRRQELPASGQPDRADLQRLPDRRDHLRRWLLRGQPGRQRHPDQEPVQAVLRHRQPSGPSDRLRLCRRQRAVPQL
ncbi:MAG: substrate-binding domain-containing protein, partial [Lysobacter sp.]|nr:substrate-binding domain-containing protein [Lysobacter sp.]